MLEALLTGAGLDEASLHGADQAALPDLGVEARPCGRAQS